MPTTLDSNPTGLLYRVSATAETPVEQMAGLDAEELLGALRGDPVDHTTFLLGRDLLTGNLFERTLRLGAILGAGITVGANPGLFEPTPITMQAITPRVEQTSAGFPTVIGSQSHLSAPPAYAAFKDLGRWLNAQDAQVSEMLRIGRTTAYSWKRSGHEPRAGTAQRVYEYHATLESLRRRLGTEEMRRWLRGGVPTRRDTLLSGDLRALDADVHAVLFRPSAAQQPDLSAAPEDAEIDPLIALNRPPRPSGRRPRRPHG